MASSGQLKHRYAANTGNAVNFRFDRRDLFQVIARPVWRDADAALIGFNFNKTRLRRQIEETRQLVAKIGRDPTGSRTHHEKPQGAGRGVSQGHSRSQSAQSAPVQLRRQGEAPSVHIPVQYKP